MEKHIFTLMVISSLLSIGCKEKLNNEQETIKLEERTEAKSNVALISSFGNEPTVARSSGNLIGVSFGNEESIFYSESVDNGDSFSPPKKVGSLKNLVIGYSSGPQIAITNNNIVITASDRTGNLYAWSKEIISTSWNGPFRINDIEKSVEECLSSITATKDGTLFCTWIDTRFLDNNSHSNQLNPEEDNRSNTANEDKIEDLNRMTPIGITKKALYEKIGDIPEGGHLAFHDDQKGNLLWVFLDEEGEVLKAENYNAYKEFKKINGERLKPQGKIYVSSSQDGGESWSISQLVYQSPDGSVCECCKPSIVSNSNGDIIIMFRNNIHGSRDLHYTISDDNGKSFSEPIKLGSGTWKIDGCPMDGGGITAFDNGNVMSVWQREGMIYTANSEFNEQIISEGRSPSIAYIGNSYSVVYTYGDDIMAIHDTNAMIEKIGTGTAPKVVATSDGTLYLWANKDGIQYKKFNIK